jgi:hypothetical protein
MGEGMRMTAYRIGMDHILKFCRECGDCLEWTAIVSKGGVPKINVWVGRGKSGRTVMSARRVVWELTKRKELPRLSLLTTSCGNVRCLNPAHLVVTDHSEVAEKTGARLDVKMKKAAKCRGRAVKLSAELASEIRASTQTSRVLAKQYSVGLSTINRIRQGRSWAAPNPFVALMMR